MKIGAVIAIKSDELIKSDTKEIVEIGIKKKKIPIEIYWIGPCGLG